MAAKIKKVTSISEDVREYAKLRDYKKSIDAKMKALSSRIKKYAESHGSKSDNGSFYCQDEDFVFGSQAKKSVSFDVDKAVDFFKKRGLFSAFSQVTSFVINEDEVESLVSSGVISFSDLESITNTKVTYSVDVKARESLPEVEVGSIAARRK